MSPPRLKDWTDLTAPERDAAFDACCRIAEAVQSLVAPFVEIRPGEAPHDGPLAGLPYAAKDMFQTPGRAPTWGLSAAPPDLAGGAKAEVLRRLDEAGARRVGFTRMTALAYEPSGVNPLQGSAKNPWNPDFAPGASSSGSAVAVAAGACFLALGSDTAGSLRIPAQGCGVTAWKPTHGAVPDAGAMPLGPSLDCIGLLARSARDILLAAPRLADLGPARGPARSIAVADDALAASHRSIGSAVAQALDAVQEIDIAPSGRPAMELIEAAGNDTLLVMQAEAVEAHHARLGDPDFDPTLVARLRKGLEIDAAALREARDRRVGLQGDFETLLAQAEILALPVMPIRTPPLSETDPASPEFRARRLYELSAFTRFANFLGLPVVAMPVGFDDRGLPVALQLVGRPGADLQLLQTAAVVQGSSDWHGRLPTALAPLADLYGGLLQ